MVYRPQSPSIFQPFFVVAFMWLGALPGFTQTDTFTVRGRVTDASTGEYVLGANVIVDGQSQGASTNIYGFYSLTLPKTPSTLTCSFIGYAPLVKHVDGTRDVEWNVELAPQSVAVDAATVAVSYTHLTLPTKRIV